MPVRLRRATLATVSAAMASVLLASPSVAQRDTPVPFPASPTGLSAPVPQPRAAEDPAGYLPQVSCNPVRMPGVQKLQRLTLSTYQRGYDGGVARSCVVGGNSEHKEGRAWDWMLDVHDRADRRVAGHFLAWLTKAGPDGRPGLQARRLGIMYVIHNRKMWSSYNPTWRDYNYGSPHTDHIHISFGWAGARGDTSFWTGKVAGPDFGPCAEFEGQPARISYHRNPRPCDALTPVVKRSGRPVLQVGSTTAKPVRAAQRLLGVGQTGRFDTVTWRAVKRYQRNHDLPVTGALDTPTWASLSPKSVQSSLTEGIGALRAGRVAARRWPGAVLRRGSSGAPVAFLQAALRLPDAHSNGFVGRNTRAAVRAFKVSHGLSDDGVVGRRTWQALARR